MVISSPAPPTEADGDDFDWRGLILAIQNRSVVPIVGTDLYATADDGSPGFDRAVARQLATQFAVDAAPDASMREIAFRAVQKRPQRQVHAAVRDLYDAIATPPRPLTQLAEIHGLELFLTTGVDRLLETALVTARGAAATTLSSSTRGPIEDLPAGAFEGSIVYHLLGSTLGEFALTEADVLERLHGLVSERRPDRLFDALRDRNLLFLGCGFPDWLARFFIRIVKGTPFSPTDGRQVIADDRVASDANLVMFLRHYALDVYQLGNAARFVTELHRRWTAIAPPPTPAPPPAEQGSVFLSFCSLDREIVRTIANALAKARIDVFFDERDLEAGDEWDLEIRRNLERCSLFVPFVSKETEVAKRRYFWSEWKGAVDVDRREPPGETFIIPVALDAIDPQQAKVPERFTQVQWYLLPERAPTEAFVAYIVAKYREKQRKEPKER